MTFTDAEDDALKPTVSKQLMPKTRRFIRMISFFIMQYNESVSDFDLDKMERDIAACYLQKTNVYCLVNKFNICFIFPALLLSKVI
ncbi:hypothetical protein N824_16195 [Pedobacter sp. V48]|nr:hypothetical protein N824_16195 [Pedobacter sp. V48]